jgi:peptidyl-dipeptidase A
VGAAMAGKYQRYVELANEGAKEMGYADLGELWRSNYDMSPDDFAKEVDRLWSQVQPLYNDLHCYVRGRLSELYGADKVPQKGPIPAHLLGNMWAQDWSYLGDLLMPDKDEKPFDLAAALKAAGVDEVKMVKYAEDFFVSMGLKALPPSFWERSMFTKPKDREVVCHASAWDIDWQDDLRIKMCIKINEEDFVTIHHELGHNYYQRAYKEQPPLFTNSANDGFHEALGDTIALSVTPSYLKQVGLLEGDVQDSLNPLMRQALARVAFLPFGVVIDKWRWQVFAGELTPEKYNAGWWKLRLQYQGIAPVGLRPKNAFDPGAKYHIPANVPYIRYFLAHILQFQFHRALCKIAGYKGPLHLCSIYGNKAAGKALNDMMEMGMSKPWPEALKALTGGTQMDATAILDYFKPLHVWLKEQNKGRTCGW